MGKGNSDEDDAAAAAREARESLERIWAPSAGASGQDEEEAENENDGQLLREVRQALPELEGEVIDRDSATVSPGRLCSMHHK